MTGGIVDRLRSMDVGGVAFLTGHVVASAVRNAVSTALVLGVAFAIGFRPHAERARLARRGRRPAGLRAGHLLVRGRSSACSPARPRRPAAFTFLVMFLPYASSAFVPIDTMPTWLHGFAGHQPVTPVIDSVRSHLLTTPAGSSTWQALAWCGGILLVSAIAAAVLFQHRTART